MFRLLKRVKRTKRSAEHNAVRNAELNNELQSHILSFDLESTKEVLEKGATPGGWALKYACQMENPEMVELLLKHNVEVNWCDEEGNTALMLSFWRNKEEHIVSYYKDTKTVTQRVVLENYDMIKLLLKAGADVNVQNNKGDTALMILCGIEDEKAHDIAEIILEYEADPSIKNNKRMTALRIACTRPTLNLPLISMLLHGGGDEGEIQNLMRKRLIEFGHDFRKKAKADLRKNK